MKITSVESIVLRDTYHLVRVHTDQGISGVGEISPMATAATHALVDGVFGPLLVGEDPRDVERLWSRMRRAAYKFGPTGVQPQAIAGVDIALWDITARAAGIPLYAMLGGRFRDGVEVYASSMSRGLTARAEAEKAAHFKDQGFKGYKFHIGDGLTGRAATTAVVERATAVREAVGDGFPVLVDASEAFVLHEAVDAARRLAELGVWHLEEPLPAHDYDSYARLTAHGLVPIAAGEQAYTRGQFKDLAMRGGVDILQPNVTRCGGITELRKIAALAEILNKPVTCHNTQPTIGTVAHLHLWVSSPACVYPQEYNIEPHPLRDDYPIWTQPLTVSAGVLRVPDGPGLGVDLDESVVRLLRTA